MSTLQPPGSWPPLRGGVGLWHGDPCGGLGLSPQHQLPKSTGSPDGLDPPTSHPGGPWRTEGGLDTSANTSPVVTLEAERWGPTPGSPSRLPGAPMKTAQTHPWAVDIATRVKPHRHVAGSCTKTPPFSTPASGKKPTPSTTLTWPPGTSPCSDSVCHHLRRNCPQITDLCFCIKTSYWACPGTSSDIPVPLLKDIWTPNQKEVDYQPGQASRAGGLWEDLEGWHRQGAQRWQTHHGRTPTELPRARQGLNLGRHLLQPHVCHANQGGTGAGVVSPTPTQGTVHCLPAPSRGSGSPASCSPHP